MINVIASIHVKEGQMPTFLEIFKANIPNVLKEKGCMEYIPTLDVPTGLGPQELNPDHVTILEKWGSLEDLKAHLASPPMRIYQEEVKNIVEKVSLKVLAAA
jgi:quinol monooxygenase YgiN